jgi:16S rRNA (adenine1518-N6/adenine1519-N6)-dimethyltransferase
LTPAFPDARTLLKRYGLAAKKSWGQNFLISDRVYRAIVDATVKSGDDWVVEVGSGLGTLTMRLAERVPDGQLIAVEREPDMLNVLKAELEHLDNVEVHAANAMTYDFAGIARWRGEKIAVCGNLPYQIASQILFRFLDAREHITHAVAMVQKEMADRMVSPPGVKAYGAMTVMLAAYADISTVVQARPGDFSPPPRVDSTVVKLNFLDEPRAPIPDPKAFSKVVHAAFSQRRKTLRNALQGQYDKETVLAALDQVGIDGGRRGETLSVAEFAALTEGIVAASDA